MNPQTFAWLVLAASVLAEVLGTLALRYTEGFTRVWPSVAVVACYSCAIWLMSVALKHIEMGLTYVVWAGTGTALTALLGIMWYQEATSVLRLAGLGCIVVGVIALNLSAK
ncbi:multidrug efflux SMR transporter [Aquabacterium sp. CECT 9606]|uniref:DMT family transporter n=1 Tax=Aquabacterium sp. CECT 9606 TaxID=2845822 RepID=UPI001E481DCC|nr:multidrug efflux SMR transporter [Aquabacterium sp. CECT 9606]CAH0350350.1 Multidrug transporter EmrE [Aquabacterium sp. CECT 9606]